MANVADSLAVVIARSRNCWNVLLESQVPTWDDSEPVLLYWVLVLVLDLYLSTIFGYCYLYLYFHAKYWYLDRWYWYSYLWESTCCQDKVIFCCNWHTLASVLWDSECLDYWFLGPSFTIWHYLADLYFISFLTFRSAIFETTWLLIADSWSSMQQTTIALTIEAGRVGLCTNPEKCEILTTTVWNDRLQAQISRKLMTSATLVATYHIMAVAKRTSEFASGKQQQCLGKWVRYGRTSVLAWRWRWGCTKQ